MENKTFNDIVPGDTLLVLVGSEKLKTYKVQNISESELWVTVDTGPFTGSFLKTNVAQVIGSSLVWADVELGLKEIRETIETESKGPIVNYKKILGLYSDIKRISDEMAID